jgi:predicted nucleotidyltransferase
MLTQRSVIKDIKKFADEIKLTGIHLHKVILFGSYAKNTQGKWSDIDVALIADEFNGVGFIDTGLFSKVLIKYPHLNIQPHTYNTNDFFAAKDSVVAEILKTGIEITP